MCWFSASIRSTPASTIIPGASGFRAIRAISSPVSRWMNVGWAKIRRATAWLASAGGSARLSTELPSAFGGPVPAFLDFVAQNFGILPGVGEGMQIITAAGWAHFRHREHFTSGRCGSEPGAHHFFDEGPVVEKLRGKASMSVRDGHLAMMAVKWPEMELLGAPHQIQPHAQALPIRRRQMFDHAQV